MKIDTYKSSGSRLDLTPDTYQIKAHLGLLFESAHRASLIELRFGKAAPNQSKYFRPTEIDEAAAFAAKVNSSGVNVYVGVNPRKPDTDSGRAASDNDVDTAFFHFADLDTLESVEKANQLAIEPSFTLVTGTIPSPRKHLYYALSEPTFDMDEWREMQRRIATEMDGDPVINPSRIMRLAGCISWPSKAKQERGYVKQLTELSV